MAPGRRLRGISGDQAMWAFQRAGYVVDHSTGSHHILLHATRLPLSVPRHRELRVGMLSALIDRAGLTVDEFEALL